MQSSQVGRVAPSQRARWDTRRRMELALTLLADPALDVLITGESDFEELPAADGAAGGGAGRYPRATAIRYRGWS